MSHALQPSQGPRKHDTFSVFDGVRQTVRSFSARRTAATTLASTPQPNDCARDIFPLPADFVSVAGLGVDEVPSASAERWLRNGSRALNSFAGQTPSAACDCGRVTQHGGTLLCQGLAPSQANRDLFNDIRGVHAGYTDDVGVSIGDCAVSRSLQKGSCRTFL